MVLFTSLGTIYTLLVEELEHLLSPRMPLPRW